MMLGSPRAHYRAAVLVTSASRKQQKCLLSSESSPKECIVSFLDASQRVFGRWDFFRFCYRYVHVGPAGCSNSVFLCNNKAVRKLIFMDMVWSSCSPSRTIRLCSLTSCLQLELKTKRNDMSHPLGCVELNNMRWTAWRYLGQQWVYGVFCWLDATN